MQVFDYPNDTNSSVNFNSWFINDMVTLTPQLTLNAGVRFDRYGSWLPEQGNGAGAPATENIYPENHDFPVYNKWSPRVSTIYDVTGNGRVALKTSYGRYAGIRLGSDRGQWSRCRKCQSCGDENVDVSLDWSNPLPPNAADLTSVSGGDRDARSIRT